MKLNFFYKCVIQIFVTLLLSSCSTEIEPEGSELSNAIEKRSADNRSEAPVCQGKQWTRYSFLSPENQAASLRYSIPYGKTWINCIANKASTLLFWLEVPSSTNQKYKTPQMYIDRACQLSSAPFGILSSQDTPEFQVKSACAMPGDDGLPVRYGRPLKSCSLGQKVEDIANWTTGSWPQKCL